VAQALEVMEMLMVAERAVAVLATTVAGDTEEVVMVAAMEAVAMEAVRAVAARAAVRAAVRAAAARVPETPPQQPLPRRHRPSRPDLRRAAIGWRR